LVRFQGGDRTIPGGIDLRLCLTRKKRLERLLAMFM
jgi:hypothetical protein